MRKVLKIDATPFGDWRGEDETVGQSRLEAMMAFLGVVVTPGPRVDRHLVSRAAPGNPGSYLRITVAWARPESSSLLGLLFGGRASIPNRYGDYAISLKAPGEPEISVQSGSRIPEGLPGAGEPALRLVSLSGRGTRRRIGREEFEQLSPAGLHRLADQDPLVIDAVFGPAEFSNFGPLRMRAVLHSNLDGSGEAVDLGGVDII